MKVQSKSKVKAITKTELKRALKKATRCNIQHNGWTCGTCFFAMDKSLTNADWQAVLLFRGDNKREELHNLPADVEASLRKVLKIAKRRPNNAPTPG